jgi:hypothetical protein
VVPVVDVGIVRVIMGDGLMTVRMGVRLSGRIGWGMRVPVVLVVAMGMRVLHRLVSVDV